MGTSDFDWREWLSRFEHRANRPLPSSGTAAKDTGVPPSVARSLAIFQLGESGGGSVVAQARASRLSGIDGHYAAAVALFVREEHRHAAILADCVASLGGRLIAKNWTARLFVQMRRLLGLRFKILVLLAAEVVGLCYYNLLAAKLPGTAVGARLSELVEDERLHLRFHCCFLRRQTQGFPQRMLFVVAWRVTMLAAALAVLLDHYPAMRDTGLSPAVVWRRFMLYCRLAEKLVVSGPPPLEALQVA